MPDAFAGFGLDNVLVALSDGRALSCLSGARGFGALLQYVGVCFCGDQYICVGDLAELLRPWPLEAELRQRRDETTARASIVLDNVGSADVVSISSIDGVDDASRRAARPSDRGDCDPGGAAHKETFPVSARPTQTVSHVSDVGAAGDACEHVSGCCVSIFGLSEFGSTNLSLHGIGLVGSVAGDPAQDGPFRDAAVRGQADQRRWKRDP